MNNLPTLITVIFEDKTIFQGGNSYLNTRWLEIPDNKKIRSIIYRLPDGNHLLLDNYDSYFHMIEATKEISGINQGKTVIEYAYIMGRKNNNVLQYKICLKLDKEFGNIIRTEYNVEDKYIKSLSINGWKGIVKEEIKI